MNLTFQNYSDKSTSASMSSRSNFGYSHAKRGTKKIKLSLRTKYDESIETDECNSGPTLFPTSFSIEYEEPTFQRVYMVDKLNSMMKQESTYYKCDDYMGRQKKQRMKAVYYPSSCHSPSGIADSRTSGDKVVDQSCREKICDWCYRVIDYFDFDREIVYFAMNYLDRFTKDHPMDRPTYKLAATTAVTLAIKIHQPKKISLNDLVPKLSCGAFGVDEILRMELAMLRVLDYHLHCPTPANYVLRILALDPFASRGVKEFDMDSVQTLAIFFVELSVSDYFFVTQDASKIAVAAIVNAIEGLGMLQVLKKKGKFGDSAMPCSSLSLYNKSSLSRFITLMLDTIGVARDGFDIEKCRYILWELYRKSDEFSTRNKLVSQRNEQINDSVCYNKRKILSSSMENMNTVGESPKSIC